MMGDVNPTVELNNRQEDFDKNNDQKKFVFKKARNILNGLINVNIDKSSKVESQSAQKRIEFDVRKAADEWFIKVEGLCPPIRIGDPEDIAKRYYELEDSFVTKIDKEYDELPDKRILYDILDNLKKEQNYR